MKCQYLLYMLITLLSINLGLLIKKKITNIQTEIF